MATLRSLSGSSTRLRNSFEVDQVELRRVAVERWIELSRLNFSGRALKAKNQFLARLLAPLAEFAHRERRFDEAAQLYERALSMRPGTLELVDRLDHRLSLAQNREPLEEDQAAVTELRLGKIWWQVIGEHWYFELGNWAEGVRFLARGLDADLASIAKVELAGGIRDVEKLQLGDLWWNLAKQRDDKVMFERAGFWYARVEVVEDLERAQQERIGSRIAQIEDKVGFKPTTRFDSPQIAQREWAKRLKLPVEFENSVGMRFRLIPPGILRLGTGANAGSVPIERPFYLGATEVTQAQFETVVGIRSTSWFSPFGGGGSDAVRGEDTADYPVEYLTQDQIDTFLYRLTEVEQAEGRLYRLPKVSEWEYAARGDTQSKYTFGDDARRLSSAGWYVKSSQGKTHSVGMLSPNNFGLYDMHGNVWEWCLGDKLTRQSGFANDRARAFLVGGGWNSSDAKSRIGYRDHAKITKRAADLGFRVLLEIDSN